jgi:hypothetical protein
LLLVTNSMVPEPEGSIRLMPKPATGYNTESHPYTN